MVILLTVAPASHHTGFKNGKYFEMLQLISSLPAEKLNINLCLTPGGQMTESAGRHAGEDKVRRKKVQEMRRQGWRKGR